MSDAITIHIGGQSAGNGGAGSNYGNISSAPHFSYYPTNSAEGAEIHHSNNVTANTTADQHNHVWADQHQYVLAGVGGDGGNDNMAIGGTVSVETAQLSDVLNHSEHFHVSDFVHV
jgi:hypothetical protein